MIRVAAAGVVLVLGCFDQLAAYTIPNYQQTQAWFGAHDQFYRQLEAALPVESMVFQVPWQQYPESPPLNGVAVTEQVIPFMHTSTIRWSGGAIHGRARADWSQRVAAMPAQRMVRELAAADFEGILVDRTALGPDSSLDADLTEQLGEPQMVSSDDRMAYFSLRTARAALEATSTGEEIRALADDAVRPTLVYPGTDMTLTAPDGAYLWTSTSERGALRLDNARTTVATVRLTLTVVEATGLEDVTLTHSDGRQIVIPRDLFGTPYSVLLDAPAGQSDVRVAPGPRTVSGGGPSQVGLRDVVAEAVLTSSP